ncbi:MAG: DUF6034 family protein [Lachnospiraceae bacterium]|nr:DUF6034 family protein [Lachnospiraceae bacterium]
MRNRMKIMFLSILYVVLLTGCGKSKDAEDDFNAIQEGTTSASNSFGDENTSAVENANTQTPEHVQYSMDAKGAGNKLTVDADVISDHPDKINVFNMQEITINKDYLLNLSKNIFDNGEYTVKKPVWLCSISELNEEKEYLDQLNKEIKDQNGDVAYRDSMLYQNILEALDTNAPLYEAYNTDDVILQTQVNGEPGETARIQGKINGEEYELFYIDANHYKELYLYKIGCTPEKIGYHFPEQTAVTDTLGENVCNREQAEALANDFISSIGFDDYRLVQTFLARGAKEMDDSPILDGYRFEYVPVLDGVENAFTIYTRATTEYDPDREKSEFAEQPVIQIDVDSTGITAVRFGKLYEVGTTVSSATNFISFDTANEAVKSAFENTLDYYCTINKIKFEYITVQYEKQYVNIPAWVYYTQADTSETIAVVACNALDGSVIYFEPSLDRYLWYN